MDVRPRGSIFSRSAIVSGNAYRVLSSYRGSETVVSGPTGLAGKATQRVLSAERQGSDLALRDALRRTRQGRWPWWWRLFGW
ncbi:MAG: hypothetical protein ACYC66_13385 [Chloroflexota bacterium]